MQHVEFFHTDHFEYKYHRKWVRHGALSRFIEFFWETDFEDLWQQHPRGFSDALFPNLGYTYLINLGTPFVMQLEDKRYEIKKDGFLPRNKHMICHHSVGNKIFGIKFRVSPIIFEKKINFFEYREFIYPLAYLIDSRMVDKIKAAESFQKRIEIITAYYNRIIEKHAGSLKHVAVVTEALEAFEKSGFSLTIEEVAEQYAISSRTLQRYFEAAVSVSGKKAFQMMRIRKAVEQLIKDPQHFHYSHFAYYDYSHFYKHLKSFLNRHSISIVQPHLQLLQGASAEG